MFLNRRLWKICALSLALLAAAPDHIPAGPMVDSRWSAYDRLTANAAPPAADNPAPTPAGSEAAAEKPSGSSAASPAPIARLSAGVGGERVAGARPYTRRKARAEAVSWVELQRRYPGTFVIAGPRGARKVALTFDDVPDPRYTPQVLDILARHKVRATFFVVGWRAAKYPAIVSRIRREGHIIGNHSYDHAVFSRLSLTEFQRQIRRTDAVIAPLAGYSPRLMRPPYGEILPKQIEWLERQRYVAVNWNVDSVDWRGIDSRAIMANIKKTLQPGSIILQHAGGGVGQDLSGTLQALPRVIAMLRSKGYAIVTLPELLGVPPGR